MNTSELMTPTVRTVRTTDSLDTAARLMDASDIGCVPVVDRDDRLSGLVTDRDICLAAGRSDRPLSALLVSEVMTRDPQTISSATSIDDAEAIMTSHQVRRLPVVDAEQHVVGLLSLNDIARAAAKRGWKEAGGLSPRKVGETLASICEPGEHSETSGSTRKR